MNEVFFSIIVPTYNRAHIILKTIESLLGQEYNNYEIIIVDDGSTDSTEEVIRPLLNDKIQYYKKANEERAAARNFGAKKAKGEYINFFDSDDIALANHLSAANKLVNTKENPEWFHLNYAWEDPSSKERTYGKKHKAETLNDIICDGNPLSCNGVFIRKDIIEKLNFNETRELSASEDYDLWIKLAARYPLHYSNEVTSLIIDHDARSVRTMDVNKVKLRLDTFKKSVLSDEIVCDIFSRELKKIKMYADLYVAVHAALINKYKFISISFLFKCIFTDIRVLKTKAFYATIKNILIKW